MSVSTNNDAVDGSNNGIFEAPAMDSQLFKCFTWIFFHWLLKMVPEGGQQSQAVL